MSEIRNGDVVYYRSDGRGRKFDGNLYILSIRDNSCAAKDEDGKTHIFSSNHFLSFLDNAIPTGQHFKNESDFFEHLQDKSHDLTLEEPLKHLGPQKSRGPHVINEDVLLKLKNYKNGGTGQIYFNIFNPYRGFDEKSRFNVVWVEEDERLYLIEAGKNNGGLKVQHSNTRLKIAFTHHILYRKLESEGRCSIQRNWKLDSKCHAYYISLKEETA